MKIISEEQEDADDFGNTSPLHLDHRNGDVGASIAGNCISSGEGRKAAVAATATCKFATELRYRDGDVAADDAVGAVNGGGGGGSSLPVTVTVRKKKKKATRTSTLDGSYCSEKQRFQNK